MGSLGTLDLIIFFASLLGVMALGLWAGRKEDTSEDYYLAGKNTRWWGVAGSIFGSNVSANHIVGMMGVGFSVGFAQSHFEITAIVGLLMLCYFFLPVYRKLNVYTLSEYLGKRYDDKSRIAYALIMVIIMVIVQMVPGFYIGSRSINILLQGDVGHKAALYPEIDKKTGAITSILINNGGSQYTAPPKLTFPENDKGQATAEAIITDKPLNAIVVHTPGKGYDAKNPPTVTIEGKSATPATAIAKVNPDGVLNTILIKDGGSGFESQPKITIAPPPNSDGKTAEAFAAVADKGVSKVVLKSPGAGYKKPPAVTVAGGGRKEGKLSPGDVDPSWYIIGILLMAFITGTYTIVGGLKAVIVTDVIQSVLLLAAGLLVAFFTFDKIGGWGAMVELDKTGADKLHLYNPSNHASLPWTGVFTGLMVLHFYYWGTNQFIVQRALSAKSDTEARFGIIAAGSFKLLIPFFSIGTGIAAWYFYKQEAKVVAQDAVFTELLTDLIAPIGFGLVGLIAAGMIGAILSSIDSMMNSAATIFTFDIYKKYINQSASEQQLILIGRICIALFIALAAVITIFTMDPNSTASFFLHVANHQGKLVCGVVVAFLLGMFWKRATAPGAIVAIITGVALSYAITPLYNNYLGDNEAIAAVFGQKLNFFHAVFVAAIISLILHIIISLKTQNSNEQQRLTWIGLGIYSEQSLKRFLTIFIISLVLFAVLGVLIVTNALTPFIAAIIASIWTWVFFARAAVASVKEGPSRDIPISLPLVLRNDRFWAGVLAASAMFMLYYFY